MVKQTINPEHKDILGRDLKVGDFVVASSYGNRLGIYSIIKMTPKMIRVQKLKGRYNKPLYSVQTVKITDERELTMLLLKENSNV